jgi:hypothetical protein
MIYGEDNEINSWTLSAWNFDVKVDDHCTQIQSVVAKLLEEMPAQTNLQMSLLNMQFHLNT